MSQSLTEIEPALHSADTREAFGAKPAPDTVTSCPGASPVAGSTTMLAAAPAGSAMPKLATSATTSVSAVRRMREPPVLNF